ncbi:hypothetical protein RPO67_09590, partial [Staphylococcus saprophyticus]|uniref:hypothetical protein n=1 Tax=Staphylococcus saprophyticus TaxID=29385 RepID=UPI0028A41706
LGINEHYRAKFNISFQTSNFLKDIKIKFSDSFELFCIANTTNYSAFSNNNEKQTYSNYTSFTCVT